MKHSVQDKGTLLLALIAGLCTNLLNAAIVGVIAL